MYRCKECKTEYKIKPDYCDCGNDTFEEIAEEKQVEKEETKDDYSPLKSLAKSLDPLSVGIFLICIILSILSLIFIGRGDSKPIEKVVDVKQNVSKKIPKIEDIWDDTPVKVAEIPKQNKVEDSILENSKQNKNQNAPKIVEAPKKNTPVIKSAPKTVIKTSEQKTKTQPPKSNVSTNKANTQTKPNTVKPSSNKIEQTQKSQTNTNSTTKTQTTNQSNVQNLKPKISENDKQAKLELKQYKNGLRNLLFSKIDFAQIEGNGTAIISFKVDGSGYLTSKNFVQQSACETLNDAIFNAVNTTKSYKSPPASYKGETLKFVVKFYNSSYEVSLE